MQTIAAAWALHGVTLGMAEEAPAHFDPATMVRVSEVKPGMKGVGKTVFRGVEISEFGVEVLGVVPKYNTGDDVVLIRATSGPLVERACGVIGGMSGSPIYLDGRLLGAVAFTWAFEKEPIGGVTPIESMLKGYVETEAGPADQPAPATHPLPVLHGRTLTGARIAAVGERSAFADPHTINLVPVGLLSCSGYSQRALSDLAELTAPYGMQPTQGPGTMEQPVKTDLLPGAAVSVELQRGDFSISLIGTITYRDGDKLLAFGHPFMQLGAVDLPVATAYIHDFVPSYQRTDKLGSAMELVGSLKRDSAWSVGGVVGPVAKMVPVEVAVTDETTGQRHEYHVEVAKQENLTQSLVSLSIANAIEAGFRPVGEGTARVSYEVEGERGARVKRENVYWDSGFIAAACAREIATTIYVFRRNPFEPQEPSRVRMEVSLNGENTAAAVEEVYTDEPVAKAGEKLTVHVVLRPWDGKPYEKVVELPLPDDLERGSIRLAICGGEQAYAMRGRIGLLQPDFHDLPSIIADMEKTELNNQLFVAAALPNEAVGVAKYLLHRLPSSIAGILGESSSTDVTSGKEEVSRLIDCDQIILGQEMMMVAAEDKTGARSAPPRPPSPGPPGPPGEGDAAEGGMARLRGSGEGLNPVTAPPAGWAEAVLARCWPAQTPGGSPKVGGPPREPKPPKGGASAKTEKPKEKPEPDGPPGGEEEKEEGKGPAIRRLAEWRQSTEGDFTEGKAEGIAIRSDGALYVAEKRTQTVDTDQRRSVWSIAGDGDGPVYVGLGKDGRVYRLSDDGRLDLVCETGQLAVHALAVVGGMVYAGTIPEGKLYRIDPAKPGTPEVFADLPEDYIWALLADGRGGLFVGTGSEGRLYHVNPQGEAQALADLPAQHVLCLARLGDDLLAGTAETGVVYRVKPTGQFEALYNDEDPAVTGVGVTTSGEAYICTSDSGHVVRVTPGKEQVRVLDLDTSAAAGMAVIGDTVYVATTDEGKLIAILDPEKNAVVAKVKAAEVSCLAAAGKRLIAGSANPGRVEVFDTAAGASGSFLSAVLDAERTARWGTLRWTGQVPDGGAIELRLRMGATDKPDDGTWGPWSYAYTPNVAAEVSSLPARFVQYRVEMTKANGGGAPIFRSLLLKYLPANQEPTIKLTEPADGAAISGKSEVKWDASDPDSDRLRYSVHVRRDGSDEWKLLADQLEDETYEWDTKDAKEKVEDGAVAIRVVASDAAANPVEPLSKESIAYSVIIDNTLPTVAREGDPQVGADRTATVRGEASDSGSGIVSVEYRTGAKEKWQTAKPVDGLFDSPREAFEIHTAALDPGEHVVAMRARDAAGNTKDLNVTVVVPKERKDETGEGSTNAQQPGKGKPKGKHGR